MNMQKMKKALPWLVLLAAYLCSVAYWGLYGSHNLISDDSAEMILAQQLNEEGRFITDNWYYSNEIRLASPVQVYQLTLAIFPDNWQAARTLAVAIMILGVLGSFVYLAYGLGIKKAAPWMGTVFALPFSGVYTWLVINQGHYCIHVIFSLLLLGAIVRCARADGRRRTGLCVFLALAAFVSGLNGVRIMMMFIAPVFAAELLVAAYTCKAYPTFKAAAHEPAVRMFKPTMLTTAFAGLGYLVNMVILGKRYPFYSYDMEGLKSFSLTDILHQVDGMIDMFGYRDGVSFFSIRGISGFVAIGIVFMLFIALFRMLGRFGTLSAPLQLLTLTAATAVALGMLLNVSLGQMLVRYFLVGILLLMVVLAAALETEPCKNGMLRGLISAAVICCFFLQTGCNLLYGYTQGTVNYEIAAEWLLERGYTQGYATYWNALPLTEVSDGQIEMWSLKVGGVEEMQLFTMNQTREHFENDPQGRVFLLVDEIENASDSPLLSEEHLVDFVGWSYYVYEYESVDEMRALIAQP